MKRGKTPTVLLLTPPFVQTNTPYPATMHLTGYLRGRGYRVFQRDLSIKVARAILLEYGGEEIEELLELLGGNVPADAKLSASAAVDQLALALRDEVDPAFGFSRYAERLSASARDFSTVERAVKRRGIMDEPLEQALATAIQETRPAIVGVTCPFPGTLVGAFKIARYLRRHHPEIRLALGGGFVSTELREMTDPRPRRYFDEFMLDEGYAAWDRLLGGQPPRAVPPFVAPDYEGVDWGEYFDVVETENPMHRLWSVGKWIKLVMARGCYWHKCAFCDVNLDYICSFAMPPPGEIVDAMERFLKMPRRFAGFHFVDEAMPPALLREVSEEIVRRGLKCQWWGNIRFDTAFTGDLPKLMARAGCIAVTGGLECADDRLLALMNKGITLKSARAALKALKAAGIMTHAYLMYGFPTETEAEAWGALKFVRGLFRTGLLDSAFWHRFALTVHSPICRHPAHFGIELSERPVSGRRRIFARNELEYVEPNAPNWNCIGKALELALYNFMQGRGLSHPLGFWSRLTQRMDI